MDVRVGRWRKLSAKELMLLNCGVGEDSWESLELQGDQPVRPKGNQYWIFFGRTDVEAELQYFDHLMWRTDSFEKTLILERLKVGEGDNRGWDGWMASPTQWTCVWVDPRSWRWTGRPGMLQFSGSQRVGHDWATELTHNFVPYVCDSFWLWISIFEFIFVCSVREYSDSLPTLSLSRAFFRALEQNFLYFIWNHRKILNSGSNLEKE